MSPSPTWTHLVTELDQGLGQGQGQGPKPSSESYTVTYMMKSSQLVAREEEEGNMN